MILVLGGWEIIHAQSHARSDDQGRAFDYYVLSLSWSPEFCAGSPHERVSAQCKGERKFGFVVHGLWPQYEHGYPEFCRSRSRIDRHIIQQLLPIMPNEGLIRYQWKKHGSCSGLTTRQYAEKIEDAFALVTIPSQYKNPIQSITVNVRDLKHNFVAVNRHFTEQSFAVTCKGTFLREVRVCLDKELNPRQCGSEIRDACRSGTALLRPVR
ncbi:MAG: ribonuclease T(2) [Candidatus Binatia bacterium]